MAFDPIQTSYTYTRGLPGPGHVASPGIGLVPTRAYLAQGKVLAGYGVFKAEPAGAGVANIGSVFHKASPSKDVDVDAIKGATATAASEVTTTVTKTQNFYPQRNITLTLNSHADWDATTGTITFTSNGRSVTENLAIPDGGNTTLTTTAKADHDGVVIVIPAQTGTNGSFTVGISALTVDLAALMGVVRKDRGRFNDKSFVGLDDLGLEAPSEEYDYLNGQAIPVVQGGEMFVACETASVDGAQVYVRVTASGSEVLGAFRNDTDGGDAVAVTGWKFGMSLPAGTAYVVIPPGLR